MKKRVSFIRLLVLVCLLNLLSVNGILCVPQSIAAEGATEGSKNEGIITSGMSQIREKNREVVRKWAVSQYWRPEFNDMFTADFTIEMPFAPPGMNQVLCVGQTLAHRYWLTRTVRSWYIDSEKMKIYGPKEEDGNIFWIIRDCQADVYWGGAYGKFQNHFVSRVTLVNGKINHLKEFFDPLEFLKAIGEEIPRFPFYYPDKTIEAGEKVKEDTKLKEFSYDASPEAIAERGRLNVETFLAVNYFEVHQNRTFSPDYRHIVYYAPKDMHTHFIPEELPAFDAWLDGAFKDWNGHPDIIAYETEDPRVWFFESGGYGIVEWPGSGIESGYGNRYCKFLELDEMGLIKRYDEHLNPMGKLNSINKRVPSFPYLF